MSSHRMRYLSEAELAGEREFWRGRSVLVTGIGGFVGSWVAEGLLAAGARVTGIVRDTVAGALVRGIGGVPDLSLVDGSIVDYVVVERAVNEYEVDTVFHLAAQAIVGVANRSPLSTFDSNIKGTWNVLEASRQARLVERVVVASSDKAYGIQKTLPYTEDTNLGGAFPYDASKVCTDVLARSYAVTYRLPVAVARCANIYGGGDLNWSRVIPGTVRSIIDGEAPIIRSDGTPERDYIFALDAVRAYLALGRNAHRDDVRGQAFNFGSGAPVAVLPLVRSILRAGDSTLEPRVLGQGATPGEIDLQFLDSRRARSVLGWTAETDLDTGLARTFAWYRRYFESRLLAATEMVSA